MLLEVGKLARVVAQVNLWTVFEASDCYEGLVGVVVIGAVVGTRVVFVGQHKRFVRIPGFDLPKHHRQIGPG